ncbi:Hpt domain-containing protein [Aliikangiella sp. IMCC44359]|uniref:Hpt domain-containing protein n=1 Tax=Aliikangiella sp. IMCC44359 TaxID=3459125 RepID=UPI00403B1A4F
MSDNYDQLALSWVRKEINNTLDQARQGLENFAEDTQDQTQIQFCINCLHQVQGTLQMLEFSGAARLALEMEKLAEKMATDSAFAVEAVFEVLMRALLQIPGYLERVEDGQKDIPVVLLPLINELRSAGALSPISERELFSADTNHVMPPKAVEVVSEKDKTSAFQDNARKLRAHFQKGLTGLIRGANVKECLSRIHKVLLRLEALTEGESVARLWWVADGFIFSITEGGLYKKKEIHLLLSKVDKQIKRLSDQGASAMADVIPEKLLSELLYFVARSHSKNARVVALKKEFNLEAGLSDSSEIKQHQEKLTKPDSSAVTNVVGAINEELATVKDQLDLFVRAQAKDISQLQTLTDSLTRIADTLTLLELAIPRDVIRQQIKSIQKLLDTNQMPDDSVVMDIAGALLFVEANLKNVNLGLASQSSSEEQSNDKSREQAKESQVDEATRALIKVARKSMQSAKDRMINYIASGFEQDALSEVPNLLEEVLGGVKIIQFEQAAEILEIAKRFIEEKIISLNKHPKEEHLDALADVITSVEYYLEASEDGSHRGVSSILKGAQKSTDALSLALEQGAEITDISEASSETSTDEPIESKDLEVTDDSVKKKTYIEAFSESSKTASETKVSETAKVVPMLIPAAEKTVDETLIDDEVLEIFLEEAEEEIQVIDEMIPRWEANLQDEEALSTIRRSFHTLKGSGRLVGAQIIGEVSWAIENMLNKVIEESIPAELPVISVLKEVHNVLPILVDAFAKQTGCDENYLKLIAKAEHLSAGKQLADFSFENEVATESTENIVEDSSDITVEDTIDPVLLEIFTTEADGHLQIIANYLDTAPAGASIAVTDDLIRALHTLKGSANMAGVEPMARVTGPWEKHARIVKGSNHRMEPSVVELLKESHQFLATTLDDLKNSRTVDTEKAQSLRARIEQLELAGTASGVTSIKQRDQQFVSIFLTEGLDILHEVARLNTQLAQNSNEQSIKDSIEGELHTFMRGAEMLAIDSLELLASEAEKLATYAASKDTLNDGFNPLLTEVVEKLTAMLNRVASEEDIDLPNETITKISQWMEESNVASVPEDMDVELVELFVEEGEELIEAARELFPRWKSHLGSKEINGELRRIYHTLKGSSRMAGAMNIGELGYAAEDIFNTVLEFGRNLTTADYDIVLSTTDKLESMVAELKGLSWPKSADREVQIIRHHLSPDSVEPVEDTVVEELVLDAPILEEVIEEEIPTIVDSISEDESAQLNQELLDIDDSNVEDSSESEEFSLPDSLDTEEEVALELDDETDKDELVLESIDDHSDSVEEGTLETLDELNVESSEIEKDEVEVEQYNFDEIDATVEETESLINEIDELADENITDEEDELSVEIKDVIDESEDLIEELADLSIEPEALGEELEKLSTESEDLSEESVDYISEDLTEEIEELAAESEDLVEELEELSAESATEDEEATEQIFEVEDLTRHSANEVTVENTIEPTAPIEVSGSVQHIELDEDGEEVLEIYLEEADELLVTLDEALHDWSESHDNKVAIDLLQRTLHTFKGGARLSDLVVLGDLTHDMETYFEKVSGGHLTVTDREVDFILQGYDVIEKLVDEVREHRQMTIPVTYMQSLSLLIKGENLAVESISSGDVTEAEVLDEVVEKTSAEVVSFEEKKQQQEEVKQKTQTTDIVRVSSEQLENLVNLAGETSIFRSRLEQQMSVLRYNLEEMSSTVDRLRDQLRNLDIETDAQISYRREVSGGTEYEDFDPLEMDRYTRQQELTRGLGESAVDLLSLKESLDMLTADSETLLLQQGRVNTEMQESLMRTRMIPFESLVPRLRRMVRQISNELGKTIELSISADGEMDRSVLERMIAPLEHMLRNAMDHGIEPPEERRANQKTEAGSVKISMFREGSEVFIKLQDDGRGLNLQAIRHKAIEKGLITEKTELTDHELQQLILEAGFSTAEQVTQISGRGVGMDVVSSEIKQLGGVIEIDSYQGRGTTFTVKLPFTMSVNHALMVQLGDDVYAIPLANIEGIVRVSPFELEEYYANPDSRFEYAGIDYSMYYLGQILDHNRSANLQGITQPLPVLLLHGADHPTAIQVDDLLGSREIVVKSIGSQLSSISGLSGATILGDGRVVVILEMPALIRRIDATLLESGESDLATVDDRVPVVMVVDDSITVRKVTTRLLERHDFEVITAKDGVDALSILGEQKPDVMLLDIEMPRMDGFELATIIRHDEGLKDLPIIMITSRTGEKHRERAEQIGVNQYMGKPYNEVDLLESISALLPNRS